MLELKSGRRQGRSVTEGSLVLLIKVKRVVEAIAISTMSIRNRFLKMEVVMGALGLVNFAIGKAVVWMFGVLVVVVFGMTLWAYALKSEVAICKAETREAEAAQREAQNALKLQNSVIEANRVEYEANMKSIKEQKQKVKTEYKERVQVIEKWRENVRENNATGSKNNETCNDAMLYLNTYTF